MKCAGCCTGGFGAKFWWGVGSRPTRLGSFGKTHLMVTYRGAIASKYFGLLF